MNKKKITLIFLVCAVLVLALAGYTMDLATNLVKDKITQAVEESLGLRITLGDVRGNPFRGYRIEGVTLSADGADLLTARGVGAKVSLFSLLGGGPPVSLLEVVGFDSDVERVNRLISRIRPGEGGGELPFKKVRLTDGRFSTPWTVSTLKAMTVSLNKDRFDTDLDLLLDDLPVKGNIAFTLAEGASTLKKMDLRIGEGRLSASGQVMPELSVQGNARSLDIARLVSFWPGTNSELFKGLLSMDFAARGTWQDPEISGHLDYSGSLVSGIPVEKASARWKFINNRLDVADLEAFTLGFPLKGDLAFVFDPKSPPRMKVDLKGSAADLETLSQVSKKLKGVSGTLDHFSILLEGQVSNPEGQVSFEARKLGFRDYTASATSINARIKGGNINIAGRGEFEGAPLSLSGTVSNFMRSPTASLQGTLRSLSLDSLKKIVPAVGDMDLKGHLNADYRLSGPAQALGLSGKIWSERVTLGPNTLERPSTFFDYHLKEDLLSFSDMKAEWKRAVISGKGKISNLTSDKRTGDIAILASNLDPAFFSTFYPPVSGYRLKGEMAVEAEVKGPLSRPSVHVSLLSRALSLMDDYSFTNLRAGTDISDLKAGVPSDLRLDISADSASIAGTMIQALKVELEKKAKVITIRQGNALMGAGTLTAGGSVTLEDPLEKTALNLAVKASNIDLEKMTLKGGAKLPLAGILTGDAVANGVFENPKLSINATAPFVATAGLKVDGVRIKISGDTTSMKIEDLSGKVGNGSMSVTGDVRLTPFASDLEINGKSLELNPLLSRFEKLKPLNITGKADLEFQGRFGKGGNSGSGKATSASVRVMGMEITNIVLPLALDGERLTSPDGAGRLYGGKILNDFALNLSGMTFYDEIEIKDTDVDALLKEAFNLQGHITGRAELFAKLNGTLGEQLKYTGKGLLKTGQGQISGFKLVDLMAAVHRSKGLQFASVYAPFDLQTGKLILAKDTLVRAPQGDPLYEFLAASGGVGPDRKLNLACNGKINIKVINALLGGATGGLGGLASTQNLAGILTGVLEGAGSSLRDDDFRDVSFSLGGTFDKPSLSNIKVAPGEKKVTAAEEPADAEETPLPQKILEQVIPGVKPQDQPPGGSTAPSGEEPSLKDKILQQVIPGAKPESKAPVQLPVKRPAPVTTAAPAPKPVEEKPEPAKQPIGGVEQEQQPAPAEPPKVEATSEQEPNLETLGKKGEADSTLTKAGEGTGTPVEPEEPLHGPAKAPKVKTFRKPAIPVATSSDQPVEISLEPGGEVSAGDTTGEKSIPGADDGEAPPEE